MRKYAWHGHKSTVKTLQISSTTVPDFLRTIATRQCSHFNFVAVYFYTAQCIQDVIKACCIVVLWVVKGTNQLITLSKVSPSCLCWQT